MSTGGPGLERLRLRTALRKARTTAELTQRQVAEALDWSLSKVVRIESGQVGISLTDLRALISLYKITDRDYIDSLIASARVARYQQWSVYQDLYDKPFMSYLEFEASSEAVLNYQPLTVPGLMQTDGYARALLLANQLSRKDVERKIELRMARKSLLDNPDFRGSFLLDEAVFHRQVGGLRVHAAQIRHLFKACERPGIEIKVMPFSAGAYPGWGSSFVILELGDGYEDLLYLENPRGDQVMTRDDQELLSHYKTMFYSLFSEAVDISSLNAKFADLLDPY